MTPKCDSCGALAGDLLAVLHRLVQLKTDRWVGTLEIRFDGSGLVESMKTHRYEKIPAPAKAAKLGVLGCGPGRDRST